MNNEIWPKNGAFAAQSLSGTRVLRLSEQNIDRLMEEGTLVEVKQNECKKTTNDK
ncbi:MAG: hypothetical protein AABY34_00905 [Pseudomonadota bacterium]